jgi:formate hydrogenlyase subunit 3/multisubunit Na+/H+ antiporter MnhD subunit
VTLPNADFSSIHHLSLGLAPLFPLALSAVLLVRSWRSIVFRLTPFALLPALLTAILTPQASQLQFSWLFLEARLGLDATGEVFLLFSSLLWLLAGAYARAYMSDDQRRTSFLAFYLLTMGGNLGVILAQDMVSFYVFFSLMSFSSYGLIVHHRNPEALRAGRVYIFLVVLGEVLLYTALVLIVSRGGSLNLGDAARIPPHGVVVFLILLGFGIKAGALPLHVWLPLAHPEAPTPASAVLSGVMIKAGLLGWLRFLPLGVVEQQLWGSLCVIAGLLAVFYGVLLGLTQNNPKTVLAYSSISQMGYMTVGIGLGLMLPEAWLAVRSAVLIYAAHHALAKGALFLGVGVITALSRNFRQHALAALGLLLPALAMAGAPFTSGAAAKNALKSVGATAPLAWPEWFSVLMPLAAVGTTLLMGRFLQLSWRERNGHVNEIRGLWGPWVVLLTFVTGFVHLWSSHFPALKSGFTLAKLWLDLWPVGLGALGFSAALIMVKKKKPALRIEIPPGDLVIVADWLVDLFHGDWFRRVRMEAIRSTSFLHTSPWRFARRVSILWNEISPEAFLSRWDIWGFLFLLVAAAIFLSLALE